ncbi:MAG: thermonuclease family protein [bacterium]|nr:thermonuclease family protein [bacterium]
MSEITSVAGEANVPLEDIVSAIIVMTKQGDSFSEAAGLMSNMLTQLSISGTAMGSAFKEAAGKDFRTFIAEGGNLAQALKLIEDHVKSTGGTMTETLGGDSNFYRDQQAMRGALELTGKHMDEFLSLSLQAVDAQGLVAEASAEVADSMAMTAAQTEAATEALQIQIGQALAPSRRAWMEYKMELASGWGNIFAALNGDYAASIQAMIETNVAAATSQEDLIAISEDVAVALNKASEWDISNSREALIQELQDLVFSLIEVNETAVTSREKFDAIDAALRAVYGDAITYEKGIFMLNGATIGYPTTLYDQAVAHQEAERAAAAQAEIEAELNRVMGEAASADAVMTRNAGLWNGVEAATQLAGLLAVLDGDTIRVDLGGEIQDVRFKNVNAPEIAHGEDAAMPWAYEAMTATQAYFDENPVEMGATLDRESYDRIIADFPDLERKLVREGLAIPLPVHMTEDPELFAELEQLAKDAAAAGKGMFEDQALAARVLNGEMVDLGVYYEELAAHQVRVNEAFRDAAGPVGAFFDAIAAVADVPAWNTTGIQEAKDAVLAANDEIIASHQRLAYETYLAQNGVTQSTIDMGVAMGIFSEAEGEKRLAFANTQTAIEELITNQDNLKLSDEQLIEATGLLISGMESTPEAAANAVKGLGGLETSAENARGAVKRAHDALIAAEGNYYATFTT